MALIIGSSSPSRSTERDTFRDFIELDNIKDYKNLLSQLKNDVTSDKEKEITKLFNDIDHYVELHFDNEWAPKNKQFILDNINNPQAIQDKFNKDYEQYSSTFLDKVKELELLNITKNFTLELNGLSLDALKSTIKQTNTNNNTSPANNGGSNNTKGSNNGENTNVNNHKEDTNDGKMQIGTTSFGERNNETGHNEAELAHNGLGDVLYTGFTYASGFLSKQQDKRNSKSGDEFDPTSKQKYTYKNKDIEYRDKNKQVHDAVVTILKDFKKVDKRGNEGMLVIKDVKGLDWTKIPDILYLITRDDKMKEHNLFFGDNKQTGNDLSAWKQFVNDSNDGIAISSDKEKEFKRLLKGIDYQGNNTKKLIDFLNLFDNYETVPYINKLIDIGSRKGKSGRMQLIETANATKLIDTVSASDVSNESIFAKDAWKKQATETRGGDGAERMANNQTISDIERTGNFFSFVADVNNDGRVDQYDLTSSITGFSFYGMLQSVCDVKKDGDNFEIVNGPRTSTVLRNLLEKAYSMSHNVNLRNDIKSTLDSHEFLHTYHVFELIKKHPEMKPYMIYDIQAETEYAQTTRKIKNTYEAFNPEVAQSLLLDNMSDPIEDYFTGEAIKDALGDLYKTNIEQLKSIASKEAITLNRKVDVDVLRAMNILVSTVFLNFGPLMRAVQHDRLHSGQNDPGYTGQYNPGNSHLAIEGKIPLTKEDLQRPWNGQEKKEFIKSKGFQQWLKTTSITPLLGISTYADSEGKTQPSPVLGLGVSFDKTKMDPTQKRARHFAQVGVAYDVMDGQLFAGLNGENVRQINNQKLKDNLDTNKPYVRGLGMQYSVGGAVDVKNVAQSGLFASVGPLYQVDHLAGLDQVSQNFEDFLNPFTKPIDAKFLQANLNSPAEWNKLYIDLENDYLNKFSKKYKEPKYLHLTESMIHMFVGRLQQQKLLENLGKHTLPVNDKQKIVQAYMGQRIDGFVSTLYQAELAKLNARGLKLSKLGAKIGANVTVESLLNGGPIGAIFGMNLSFSAHNEIYGDDPHDINSVSKQLDYGAGMTSLEIPAGTSLENIASRLENAFAIPGLAITVNKSDNTLSFSNDKGGSVLNLLHLYYTPDALKKAGFSFDGEVLTVGDVGSIGIANVFKGMTRSHYLILGSDKMIGCLEHNKYKESKTSKKGDKPTVTWQALQPKDNDGNIIEKVVGFQEKKIPVLPTVDTVKKQIQTLGTQESADILPYIKHVDTQGQLILTIPQGQKPTLDGILIKKNGEYYVPVTGTFSYIKDKQGGITLKYESTPSNELVIRHKKLLSEKPTKLVIDTQESVAITVDAIDLFKNARQVLDENKVLIKTFDNINKDAFFKFLAAAKNIDNGGITQDDYIAAINQIKGPLSKHVNKTTLTQLLDKTQGEELVYIVNRLKAIFAENYIFKSAQDVHKTLNSRKNTYANILGPSGSPVPQEIANIREGFKTHLGSTAIEEKTNLLGYTAWYRNGGQGKDARGYSSTAYGHTNVLSGFIQEIQDKKETQQWMIDNLKKDQTNLETITKNINKSLKNKGISITTNNLLEILSSGKTRIDKTNKILKINVKWYFYLLGECANESVGLALDGAATIITTKPDVESQYETKETKISPEQKTGAVLNASKTTKTIDLDVKGKKGDINFVAQGSVQVGKRKENGGQGNEESTGGQGTTETDRTETDGGGQGTGEGGGGG